MNIYIGTVLVMFSASLSAADMQSPQSLITDCYQEWQSRGWTLGEDQRLADDVDNFREGIIRICEVRAELFLQGENISPYIQGRLRDLAPYIFTANKADIKQRILMVKGQTAYPGGSGFLSE
ncbi:MAG: hypothetical protein M1270_00710 [Gammaproteobacteria bacterium]|nr:hypothetical protein [Gammaproteobacteria bacterium]